jgi:hypothetical protein
MSNAADDPEAGVALASLYTTDECPVYASPFS